MGRRRLLTHQSGLQRTPQLQARRQGLHAHRTACCKGTTVTASKIDDHNIELTYKLKGKTIETDKYEVSADGKTLTQTVTYSGVSKPEVDVYDRG